MMLSQSSSTQQESRECRTKRYLLITRNLPPLQGGMERLNLHLAQALANEGHLTVIGPEGAREHLPESIRVLEVPIRPLWKYLLKSWLVAYSVGRKGQFDYILAGSGLTGPAALLASRKNRAMVGAYVHGLDIVSHNFLYRSLWIHALRRLDFALANSANTANLAEQAGVARGRIKTVHPGVTLPDVRPTKKNHFRSRNGLHDRPILLSVGRLTARKGLDEFICRAFPAIVQKYPNVVLIVIGGEARDALAGETLERRTLLCDRAEELGLSTNLRFLGSCSDAELSEAYFAADVHVFPVIDIAGDVEGFGMVAIEAAAHGLPTVAFAEGGVPDAVAHGESGRLIAPGNYQEFARSVNELLDPAREKTYRRSSQKFARMFDWSRFEKRIHVCLQEFFGRKNDE